MPQMTFEGLRHTGFGAEAALLLTNMKARIDTPDERQRATERHTILTEPSQPDQDARC